MRMFYLWLKSWVLDMLNRVFGVSNKQDISEISFKPCAVCGHYPIITINHSFVEVRCKEGCHGVRMSDLQHLPGFDLSLLAELAWQWNNIVINELKNGSNSKPKDNPERIEKHGSSQIKCDPEQSYGFGKYFIEHPIVRNKS